MDTGDLVSLRGGANGGRRRDPRGMGRDTAGEPFGARRVIYPGDLGGRGGLGGVGGRPFDPLGMGNLPYWPRNMINIAPPGGSPLGSPPLGAHPFGGQDWLGGIPNSINQPAASLQDVVKWVLETCGNNLEEATGRMKIKGIPDDFGQLVVSKPTPGLQAAFAQRAARSSPILMFHGTPLRNLWSILRDGFWGGTPSGLSRSRLRSGQVWVAEEPGFSVSYALKETLFGLGQAIGGGQFGPGGALRGLMAFQTGMGPETPYDSYGALLGCEFILPREQMGMWGMTGMPRTAVTTDTRAVIARYVFLVPPNAIASHDSTVSRQGFVQNGPTMPKRLQIERQMMENIKGISARNGRR